MKTLAILLALIAVASTVVPPDLSFDGIDLDQYEDKNKLANFIKCLGDDKLIKGCSDFEINIRERASGIMANNCAECTSNEVEATVVLTSKVASIDQDAGRFIKLLKKFDPTGKNSRTFLETLNKLGRKRKVPKIPQFVINKYPSSCSD